MSDLEQYQSFLALIGGACLGLLGLCLILSLWIFSRNLFDRCYQNKVRRDFFKYQVTDMNFTYIRQVLKINGTEFVVTDWEGFTANKSRPVILYIEPVDFNKANGVTSVEIKCNFD